MAKGKKTGGRKRGSPNKRTIENAIRAEAEIDKAKANGSITTLGRERLAYYDDMYAKLAAYYAPTFTKREGAPDEPKFSSDDAERKFDLYAQRSIGCAKARAPYESPKLMGVAVASPGEDVRHPNVVDPLSVTFDAVMRTRNAKLIEQKRMEAVDVTPNAPAEDAVVVDQGRRRRCSREVTATLTRWQKSAYFECAKARAP